MRISLSLLWLYPTFGWWGNVCRAHTHVLGSCAWNQIYQGSSGKWSWSKRSSSSGLILQPHLAGNSPWSHTHFYEVSCPTFAHSGDLERHPDLHVFGWTELFDFWRTHTRGMGCSWIMGSLGLNSKAHIALSKFKYSYNIELYCVWIEECLL